MMKIPNEEKAKIIECLQELSICKPCILRYLGCTVEEDGNTFSNPDIYFNTILNQDEEENEGIKKLKINPCPACLNVLADSTIENYVLKIPDAYQSYEIDDFCTNLNFPISILLRELGVFIHLKETFPNFYKDFSDIQDVKKVFRTISRNLFSVKLGKPFNSHANLQMNITVLYEDEPQETKNLNKINSNQKLSKTTVTQSLKTCSDDTFKQHFAVPPTIQNKDTSALIVFSSNSVFIGGRYLKFSRVMGQTPFIVNSTPIMEHSVQEMIFNALVKVLRCNPDKLTFSSSGREDADTRMLGDGRPFYVQIDEPKFDKITSAQCRAIEEGVAESNTVVVIKMQQVSQNSTKLIKFGELEKRKHYRGLCKTQAPDVEGVIRTINTFNFQTLQQATPIRVLHRRTHLIRERQVFDIIASPVIGSSDLFYLDVKTAAGTYVKEFVNGDFHRTNPNLTQITGYPVDVVALDVAAVELEWPK